MTVLSFGCRLNTVEGERIAALIAGQSGVAVVNTCAVTAAAEKDARRAVARLRRDRPEDRVVVTGCAAQIDPARWAALPGVSRVLGNAEKLDAAHWAPGAGSAVGAMTARRHAPVPVSGLAGRARAFVDVQQGCDHACTFCIIPRGRGRNRSVPLPTIADQMRHLVASGINEVVLTGVDLASWEGGLGALVRGVLRLVPELPRLRLSSLDPAALDEAFWAAWAEEERLMPHLHLSMQAGSDMMLKRMRRRHGRASGLAAVRRARSLRPGAGIGADLIAGFPTETAEHAAETLRFVGEAALPYLHVFPFSERPGTPAARMPPVPPPVRRERAARLREAAAREAQAFHAALLGRTVRLVAERGGTGHTAEWAPVRGGAGPVPGTIEERLVVAADATGVEVA